MSVSIEINTRPIRFAFLVDPDNSEQVAEAVRLSSTLWGGRYFPIIELHEAVPAAWKEEPPGFPAENPSAEEVVLGCVNAFDPDFLVQLSEDIPEYIRDLGVRTVKPADIWGDLNGRDGPPPSLGIGLFEILDRIFEERFRPVHGEIVFPKLPKELYLFWAGVFGDVPPEFDPLLEERCSHKPEIGIFRTDIGNGRAVRVLAAQKFSPTPTALFSIDLVCLYTRSSRSFLDEVPCIFFMDAAKVGDIVDFWNLRAMGKHVLPVSVQFKENAELKKAVADLLKRPEHGGDSTGGTGISGPVQFLRARSRPMEEMREYAGAFDGSSPELLDRYPRIWNAGSHYDDIYGEEGSFINSANTREDEIRIRSVLPKFRYYDRRRPVCANEITIGSYMETDLAAEAFPRFSGKNFIRAISGSALFAEDWRGGRNGLVRLVRNGFDKPQEMPSSERVFFAWLSDLGWKKPKLSSAGVLAKRILQRLGSSVFPIRDKKLLGLLEHMNGGSVKRDGTPLDANKINREREVSVAEVKSRLDQEKPGGKSLYDYAVENGFFRLGVRVQCPNCFRHSWYGLESIRDLFTCPKCLDAFAAVGNLGTDPWYYKTAGPFSIPNYADGAYAVLLALDFFYRLRLISHSFRITPVMSFEAESPDGDTVEVDFAAFWQSEMPERKVELLLCECKTYGKFEEKDLKKMELVAKTLENPVLAFSTLRESLAPEEKEIIAPMAETNPVMVLTAAEVCPSSMGDCSKKGSVVENLDYGSNLLDICNVTQKSYLRT